jgi:DNA modification methylase/superfamily II DNA or RNA helicase
MDYKEFLKTKEKRLIETGFEHSGGWSWLYPFQEYCVKIALKKGRFALFEDCGLGKTRQQITWANEVVNHTNKPVLILAPLAVVGQTIQEGNAIGIDVTEYSSNATNSTVYISNYEQLDNIDCSIFSGVVLDESSILKNFEGAIRNSIIENFAHTQYKLACTATPSPNDPMELGNHSEFLNVMSRQEMLAMYFVHDGGETSKWRLKGHCIELFYKWVSSWALMLSKPSDIGFTNDGYDLPPLNYLEKTIITPKKDNGLLFNDTAISATNHNAELRITKVARLTEVAEVVNNSSESFIIWVKQNEEGESLRKLIPTAIEVSGSDSPEYKKEKLLGFANGNFRVLITKIKIGGFGMNYQNCHNMIFASPDFSFEGLYQAIRREWRFGQKNSVNVWLITTDTMANVIQSLKNKQKQFEIMQSEMQKSMNTIHIFEDKQTRPDVTVATENAIIRLGDSVQLIKDVPDNSIGFSMFSPPFAELYTYSSELEDMGNSKNYKEFFTAFNFLVKDLFRIMWDGRNVAVHCMDLPIQKGKEGYIGLRDFSGMILQAFQDAGFIYHSRVTIWKNPVTEMQRTKALGLLHKQVKKDASMSRVGIPDYLLVFRKPGVSVNPVECKISVDTWQQYASPVWMDIDYGDTLNARAGRDERDEKHICPLQLPTIERATILWSNEGDTCYTPFGGIGSEPFKWLELKRKVIAGELKQSYFDEMVKTVKSVELKNKQTTTLF